MLDWVTTTKFLNNFDNLKDEFHCDAFLGTGHDCVNGGNQFIIQVRQQLSREGWQIGSDLVLNLKKERKNIEIHQYMKRKGNSAINLNFFLSLTDIKN